MSSTWRMLSASSGSLLGPVANQASRISSSTGWLVVRSESASTFASFHFRAPRAVSASAQSAARIPSTLLAAIDAPVPVQQQTMPCSARPSATSRAAASLAQAQSGRSSSASAPCTIGSCPRRRISCTTSSATPVRLSAATEIRIGGLPGPLELGSHHGSQDRPGPVGREALVPAQRLPGGPGGDRAERGVQILARATAQGVELGGEHVLDVRSPRLAGHLQLLRDHRRERLGQQRRTAHGGNELVEAGALVDERVDPLL